MRTAPTAFALAILVTCFQEVLDTASASKEVHQSVQRLNAPMGMVWIAGGEFTMGSDDDKFNERPAHRVKVDGFWMDEHPVTTGEFEKFVQATGYVTTAERKPDWEELKKQLPPGTSKPDDSVFAASTI